MSRRGIPASDDSRSRAQSPAPVEITGPHHGTELVLCGRIRDAWDISGVPANARRVKGSLRREGRDIPLVDLRIRFGVQEPGRIDAAAIVIVELDEQEFAFLVEPSSEA